MGTRRITPHGKGFFFCFFLQHIAQKKVLGVHILWKGWIFFGVPAFLIRLLPIRLSQHIIIAFLVLQMDFSSAASEGWTKERKLGYGRRSPGSLHSHDIERTRHKLTDDWGVSWGLDQEWPCLLCQMGPLRNKCLDRTRQARDLLGKTPVRIKGEEIGEGWESLQIVM